MGDHLIDGEFQSDKYPTTPRGKVPLSVKDPMAQDLLWQYAQRRREVDAAFSADLEEALEIACYRPPIIVTPLTFPSLCHAFIIMQEDSGGHLIGTVYCPDAEPQNPWRWEIPAAWASLVDPAERALERLLDASGADFSIFVFGEESEADAIAVRQGDLSEARKLLDDHFNGWQPDEAP